MCTCAGHNPNWSNNPAGIVCYNERRLRFARVFGKGAMYAYREDCRYNNLDHLNKIPSMIIAKIYADPFVASQKLH